MLTKAPFIQAKNYTKSTRLVVLGVCIHTMEAPEGAKTAENVANWFAQQPAHGALVNGIKFSGTSAHWNVDANGLVQSVREQDIAWHAGPVNNWSIGVEHAGYARQTTVEWLDKYSMEMLDRSARLVAEICRRWEIPVIKLTAEDLKAGKRSGIFGHVDVTKGLNNGIGHTDPGDYFPWQMYLAMIAEKLDILVSTDGVDVGIVTTKLLNIRSAPSTNAAIIGQLVEGVQISILDHEQFISKPAPNGWYKIQLASGQLGYVAAHLVVKC